MDAQKVIIKSNILIKSIEQGMYIFLFLRDTRSVLTKLLTKEYYLS